MIAEKNSWYTDENMLSIVTPPTLFIPMSGIKICLIGTNVDFPRFTKLLENEFKSNSITLYYSDTYNDIEWKIFMLENSDYNIFSIDHLDGPNALILGFFASRPNTFVSCPQQLHNKDVITLFSHVNKNKMYTDPIEILYDLNLDTK